jgi:hypothetical protein
MEIKVRSFTTCEVAADGGAISLGFEDVAINSAAVGVSLNQVGALIMTLPGLLEAALKARYGDQGLCYAYPMASWVLDNPPTRPSASSRWRPRTASRSASRSRRRNRVYWAKR